MTIDLSGLVSWIWIAVGVVIVYVILRYFFHIIVRIFHFLLSFFWHGCITVIALLVIYYILRALGVF
jgi:hypothetical protein